jgi:DNA-binding NarL/FixJ family response regulator
LGLVAQSMPRITKPTLVPVASEAVLSTRIVLVEDDPVYRQFVRQVLKKIDGVELVAECVNGKEGIEVCRREKPQALLLDFLLPDCQGVDVVKALREELPHLVILLLTAHPSNELPHELVKLGVQGFLDKTATAGEVAKAIRSVLAGGLSYSSVAGLARPINEPVIALPGNADKVKPSALTPREREIARLVTGAMSSKEVAARLGLSTRTVEKHRANIYAKLGVRDVVGLTRWCMYHGMLG